MTTFQDLERQAREEGFDEVAAERHWPPSAVLGTRTHPFAVKAIVTLGEM